MIRLAIRLAAADAEIVLAELIELAPSGVEENELPDGRIEYAVYGAAGELPALPDLEAEPRCGVRAGAEGLAGIDNEVDLA